MSITWIIPIFLGWLAGWLVNYFSDVLPFTRRLSKPVCLQCGDSYSLINYLTFVRCANGHKRSLRVWLVQIAMVTLSTYTYFNFPTKIGFWGGFALLIYFGVVFVIDMEHRLILHPTSIAGAILTLFLGAWAHGIVPTLLGGLGGLVIMLVFYYLGVVFARVRAKRMRAQGLEVDDEESLGQGDVILVTIIGFLIGWPLIWFCIIVSTLLGGIVSIILVLTLLVTRKYDSNALMVFIPYGPYFILGAALIVYFPAVLKAMLPG